MAVKRLTDGVDENDIVDLTDVEELNEPNILIDEEFGITGKSYDYAVVQRKIAHRTGTVEDGVNNGKVIKSKEEFYEYCEAREQAILKVIELCKKQ